MSTTRTFPAGRILSYTSSEARNRLEHISITHPPKRAIRIYLSSLRTCRRVFSHDTHMQLNEKSANGRRARNDMQNKFMDGRLPPFCF